MPSTNLAACLQMTIDGLGVAALLAPMVENEIATGELSQLDYRWVPKPLDFYARYDVARSAQLVERAAQLAVDVANEFIARMEH